MKLDEIKALIDIIQETDLTEIEIEEEDLKIKIKRGYQRVEIPENVRHVPATPVVSDQEETQTTMEEIVAPMVGTFYRAPGPDAESFVKKGDIVNPGDTLCIIEAMKLMNEIEVETRGKIVEILIENGHPVEYGEPLFIIEPL